MAVKKKRKPTPRRTSTAAQVDWDEAARLAGAAAREPQNLRAPTPSEKNPPVLVSPISTPQFPVCIMRVDKDGYLRAPMHYETEEEARKVARGIYGVSGRDEVLVIGHRIEPAGAI